MAVAMAAWSLGFHFITADNNNSLRALEKPFCCAPLLKASSGFAATNPSHIFHKRR